MKTKICRTCSAFFLLLALCLTLAACGGDEAGPIREGDACRDFTAALADGGSFTLSDHEGQAVLLNFWATWCRPCVGEMPAFPRLQEKYGDQLCLVAVNCGEDQETVERFMTAYGYTFPVALDPEGTVSALYPTSGIPYTLVIDPEGTVTHIETGAGDADGMFELYSEAIDKALN